MTSKVGHTDLVFGVRSGLIIRSVQARLQIVPPWKTFKHTDSNWPAYLISSATWAKNEGLSILYIGDYCAGCTEFCNLSSPLPAVTATLYTPYINYIIY